MNAATLFILMSLSAPSNPVSASSDEKAIQGRVDGFRQAIESADAMALEQLFWPDALVFQQEVVEEDLSHFASTVAARFKNQRLVWKDEKNSGRAEGPLAYVAQRALLEKASDAGSVRELHHFTFLLRKKDGIWKMSHLHWSRGPH